MGIVVNSLSSSSSSSSDSFLFSDALYKAAFALALLRWAFYWALKLRQTHDSSDSNNTTSFSSQLIRDSLITTTFDSCRNTTHDTCAVCLNKMESRDDVREMRNCCHVFHTECIDRWLDYNTNGHDHHTCPMCRTPLLTSSQVESLNCWDQQRCNQPSWAVERLLYLFGDDLVL